MSTKTTKLGLPLIPEAEYDTKKVIDMIKENQGTASDSAFNKIDSFASDIDTRVAGKQEKLVSGQNIKTINGKSVLGTGNIEITVPNVPVEDVTVNGGSVVANKIAKITVPTKVSDLTNDSKFITNSVNNLVNYYTKADVYTKTEIDNTLATFSKLKLTVVDSLPTTGEPDTIYLVPADSRTEHDYYNEYIWLSNKWELLGNTKIDLSDYYKKSEVDNKFATKTDVQAVEAKIPSLDGYATETYVNNHHDNTKVDKTDFKFKTVNNQEITGEGNISITVPDVPVEDVTVDGVSVVNNKTAKISLSGKQDKLVSGTNIKTINNQSILGNGNITIEAAEQVQADWNQTDTAATDFIKNKPEIPEVVSVSKTGSSTEEVKYITIGENEYKLPSGGSGSSVAFADITGEATDNESLAEALDNKQDLLPDVEGNEGKVLTVTEQGIEWKAPQPAGKEISFEHEGDTYKVNSYLNAGGLGVESISGEEYKAYSTTIDDLGLHISETTGTSDETAIQTELAISKDTIYYAKNGIDEQGQEVHTKVKKSIEDLLTGSAIPEEWKEFIEASIAESSMTEFGECDTMTLDFTEDDTRKLGLLLAYLDIEED